VEKNDKASHKVQQKEEILNQDTVLPLPPISNEDVVVTADKAVNTENNNAENSSATLALKRENHLLECQLKEREEEIKIKNGEIESQKIEILNSEALSRRMEEENKGLADKIERLEQQVEYTKNQNIKAETTKQEHLRLESLSQEEEVRSDVVVPLSV